MLQISHRTGYMRDRRYVTIRVDGEYPIDKPGWRIRGYEMRIQPHPSQRVITWEWSCHWQYKLPYKANVAMGVRIEVQYDPVPKGDGRWVTSIATRHHTEPRSALPYASWTFHYPTPTESLAPNADWGALLELGKQVAANRVEPLIVLGWVEDRLPEPWSLFASPEPIEAFRALSPIPLYEE